MRKKDIKTDYRRYKFFDKVPLISCKEQMISYFNGKFDSIDIDPDEIKQTIINTIDDSLDDKVNEIHTHIDTTKDDISNEINSSEERIDTHIDEVKDNISNEITSSEEKIQNYIDEAKEHLCCDICCAKNDIKKHIDDKIDPINFEEKFLNLNEQVAEILSVGRDAILRIEKGDRKIDLQELMNFSKLYNISMDELTMEEHTINSSDVAFARGFNELSEKDKKEIISLIEYKNILKSQNKDD